MKGIVMGRRLERDAVIIQGSTAVLIGQALAELSIGQYLALQKGLEMDPTEPVPIDWIGAMVHAPKAGEKATTFGVPGACGLHGASSSLAAEIMRPMHLGRQGPRSSGTLRGAPGCLPGLVEG
jgi:hypothetical protein